LGCDCAFLTDPVRSRRYRAVINRPVSEGTDQIVVRPGPDGAERCNLSFTQLGRCWRL